MSPSLRAAPASRPAPAQGGSRAARRVWVLAALLVLLAGLLPLGACADEADVDPTVVLKESSDAMRAIQGFHFVYRVDKPSSAPPGTGLEIARITGDVNADGSMQSDVDITQAGIPLTIKLVIVGGTQYFNFMPTANKWQAVPTSESPVGELSLTAGTIRILEQIKQPVYAGTEGKQGTDCYHITGTVAAADVQAIAGAVSTTEDFPTELWIGVEDDYVYEVLIEGPATQSEPAGIRRIITLSELNTYVDIKAPQ